jgi:hypothetical protein
LPHLARDGRERRRPHPVDPAPGSETVGPIEQQRTAKKAWVEAVIGDIAFDKPTARFSG